MTIRLRLPRREVVVAYAVLPHLTPIVAVMLGTASFAFIARGGWPGTIDLAMLLTAMLGGQLAIGATNELVDVEVDRIAKPSKPLVTGAVTERGARVMVAAGLAMMMAGSLRFSLAAFVLCILGTGLGIAYSLWFKRTVWSWLPYVLAIPLLPVWVWTALEDVPWALLALYPIAIPALSALQVAQSLPDIEGDAATGVRTLAVAIGEERARMIVWASVAASATVAAIVAPFVLPRPDLTWAAVATAIALLAILEVTWRASPHRGRLAAFPLVAAAVGALGVGWALGMTG